MGGSVGRRRQAGRSGAAVTGSQVRLMKKFLAVFAGPFSYEGPLTSDEVEVKVRP